MRIGHRIPSPDFLLVVTSENQDLVARSVEQWCVREGPTVRMSQRPEREAYPSGIFYQLPRYFQVPAPGILLLSICFKTWFLVVG